MSTTECQIDAMKEMAAALNALPNIKSAHIDDWGRFGNFTLHIVPAEHTRHSTRQLKTLVTNALPKQAHLRECFSPDLIRETRFGVTRKVGYSRSFWVFDIDYQHYDASSNSFN